VWGHFDDANLVGMVGVQRESHAQLAHKAIIWGMYVDAAHRHRGLGRALINHGLVYAADVLGVRGVNLGVTTSNTVAMALYQSLGFRIYGTEKGFLMIDGVLHDQHLMCCDLPRP
jgi:ribosomal protein S18 acetylase RimI-like enzyme